MSPFSLSTVPQHDLGSMPVAVRDLLVEKLSALAEIHIAANKLDAARRIAAANPHRLGWSAQRLITTYYAVLRDGYTAAINRSRAGREFQTGDVTHLPPQFVSFWKLLCEENQRCTSQAHTRLLRRWQAWRNGNVTAAIPGYDHCPPPALGEPHPEGWSARNLRRYAPTKRELLRARIGTGAAADLLPSVFTTRVGLKVGQYYVFDDHEFDFLVNFPGQVKALRPRMFAALDLYSGCCFAQGMKPTLWDEQEEKKKALTEREFLWLVLHVLTNVGYRTDTGTILTVEHGTATLREAVSTMLTQVTGGLVRVHKSGMIGERQMPGQSEGRARGNFKFKAHIESWFSLLNNVFADLPGQVGLDRHHTPEQLHGLNRENNRLLAAIPKLDIERANQLRTPFLTWPEFLSAALDRFAAINNRTDHDLEGWETAGHVAKEFRLDPSMPWLPADRLNNIPEPKRSAMLQLGEIRARRLAPQEVWDAGRRELTQLPLLHLRSLLPADEARRVTVRRMTIEIRDRDLSPEPMRWLARFGRGICEEGAQLDCFLNPHDPRQLIAYDPQGRFLGVAEPWQTVSRAELHDVQAQMGAVAHLRVTADAEQDARHAGFAAEHAEIRKANAEILSGRASKEDLATERRLQNRARRSAEDFTTLTNARDTAEEPESRSAGVTMQELNELG